MVRGMKTLRTRRLLPVLAAPLLGLIFTPNAAAHPLLELFGGLGPTNPLSGRLMATGGEAAGNQSPSAAPVVAGPSPGLAEEAMDAVTS